MEAKAKPLYEPAGSNDFALPGFIVSFPDESAAKFFFKDLFSLLILSNLFQDIMLVAISTQYGSFSFLGAAKQIGFVPKYGLTPLCESIKESA